MWLVYDDYERPYFYFQFSYRYTLKQMCFYLNQKSQISIEKFLNKGANSPNTHYRIIN
jgi:hypothetical protein